MMVGCVCVVTVSPHINEGSSANHRSVPGKKMLLSLFNPAHLREHGLTWVLGALARFSGFGELSHGGLFSALEGEELPDI